jgi:hypothetical protein
MSDHPRETIPAPLPNHHAAEWGLASLLLAGFLLFTALLTLLFGVLYNASLPQLRPSPSDVRLTVNLSTAVIGLLTGLSVASVVFAIVGLRSAVVRRQPAGLSLAGMLLSLVVMLLWTAIVIGLVGIIDDFSRRHIM